MHRVILAADAARAFERADRNLQRHLDRCFECLSADPRRHNNIKRLKGEFAHLMRFRVGDWRVVYQIDASTETVVVLDIAHRRDVYE
jgi:mRNA interferase RelE/StbE